MAEQLKMKTIKNEPIEDKYTEFLDKNLEFDATYTPGNWRKDPNAVRSIAEMVGCLEANPDFKLDAKVLAYNPKTKQFGIRQVDRKGFLEAYKNSDKNWDQVSLRESYDSFSTDAGSSSNSLVGNDYVPLLGGPFYKQLYFYDYIKQANAAFYAYHHDPIAHQGVDLIKNFTIGRGFKVVSDDDDALALWDAFETANKLQKQFDQLATELSVNGEIMIWKLPNNQTTIVQDKYPGQKIQRGLIPRIRLLDATVFWEIVTEPEDITNVLYYVWVAPTQYQMYTGLDAGKNGTKGSMTPSSKFIFQTIPADQILHYKVNAFSNEKRGRSDLFPVLGFLKRLRDSVNYSIISLQKQAAYCIDTMIEGNQGDINAYIEDQRSIGTIAPAGSEFVHSSKITREYKGVEGTGKGGGNVTFEWALSCVASGLGIPVSYFGTHLSGGQTRASAIVATEPVAKRFEARQKTYEQIIQDLWAYVMEENDMDATCEVTFPEIVTADRTQKLQDLSFAENMGWFTNERSANMAAKEFNANDYVYADEQKKIAKQKPIKAITQPLSPLTDPATAGVPSAGAPGKAGSVGSASGKTAAGSPKLAPSSKGKKPTSDVPSNEKQKVKKQNGKA